MLLYDFTLQLTTLLAAFGIAGGVFVIALGVCVATGWQRYLPAPLTGGYRWLQERGAALALAVSAIAVTGSLFFSELAGYEPCELCWWQRICMYPLTIVLITILVRKDARGWVYALPLSLLGLLIAAYHYTLQMLHAFTGISTDALTTCAVGQISCVDFYFLKFGFVTMPFLSMVAFGLVSVLLLMRKR